MKKDWSHLDKFRGHVAPYTSSPGSTFGAFEIPINGVRLRVIATDGRVDAKGTIHNGWEHVSVHAFDPVFRRQRTPNWKEMCRLKELFWDDNEVVMQLHPAKKDWISIHDHVLHLWRPIEIEIPVPPKSCV